MKFYNKKAFAIALLRERRAYFKEHHPSADIIEYYGIHEWIQYTKKKYSWIIYLNVVGNSYVLKTDSGETITLNLFTGNETI